MKRLVALLTLIAVSHVTEARAQDKGDVELGFDGGVGVAVFDEDQGPAVRLTVGFPFQSLRVGWFLSDRLEIEPSIGVAWSSTRVEVEPSLFYPAYSQLVEGGSGEGGLALAFHGGGPKGAGRFFARAGGLVRFANSDTQLGVELGAGWKRQLGSHWAFRAEVSAGRTFGNETFVGAWTPGLTLGFSNFIQ